MRLSIGRNSTLSGRRGADRSRAPESEFPNQRFSYTESGSGRIAQAQRRGPCRGALRTRLDCDMTLLEQGLKDNVSTETKELGGHTCATAFELYWQLRYPFG